MKYRLRIECWFDDNGVNRLVGGPGIVRDFDTLYVPFEANSEAEAVKLHALAVEHGIRCPRALPKDHGHSGTLVELERLWLSRDFKSIPA